MIECLCCCILHAATAITDCYVVCNGDGVQRFTVSFEDLKKPYNILNTILDWGDGVGADSEYNRKYIC